MKTIYFLPHFCEANCRMIQFVNLVLWYRHYLNSTYKLTSNSTNAEFSNWTYIISVWISKITKILLVPGRIFMMAGFNSHLDEKPQFKMDVDMLRCQSCFTVVSNVVQTGCGHRYCEDCLSNHLPDDGSAVKCPADEDYCETISKDQTVSTGRVIYTSITKNKPSPMANFNKYCWWRCVYVIHYMYFFTIFQKR